MSKNSKDKVKKAKSLFSVSEKLYVHNKHESISVASKLTISRQLLAESGFCSSECQHLANINTEMPVNLAREIIKNELEFQYKILEKVNKKKYQSIFTITILTILFIICSFYIGLHVGNGQFLWRGEFYKNTRLAGKAEVKFTPNIDFYWHSDAPFRGFIRDNFSARFTSCIYLSENKNVNFKLGSDDGSILIIDNKIVISSWIYQGINYKKQSVELKAGFHKIVLEYFEGGGGAEVSLEAYTSENNKFIPIDQAVSLSPIRSLFGVDFCSHKNKLISLLEPAYEKSKPQRYVAHAGGGYKGITYTNSLEALNYNYKKGFRLFEIDFLWTKDKELIALHSWGTTFKELFGFKLPKKYSEEEFLNLKNLYNLKLLNLKSLVDWFEKHPDAILITDVKNKNIDALEIIAKNYPKILHRIYPQIYNYSEYDEATKLGFTNLIFTLYRLPNFNQDKLTSFVKKNELLAVGLWPHLAKKNNLLDRLKKLGVNVYIYTLNNPAESRYWFKAGADAIYTDFIAPEILGEKN